MQSRKLQSSGSEPLCVICNTWFILYRRDGDSHISKSEYHRGTGSHCELGRDGGEGWFRAGRKSMATMCQALNSSSGSEVLSWGWCRGPEGCKQGSDVVTWLTGGWKRRAYLHRVCLIEEGKKKWQQGMLCQHTERHMWNKWPWNARPRSTRTQVTPTAKESTHRIQGGENSNASP